MKNKEKLTHQEIMDALSDCFRELIQTDITHRNMPNIINRGKTVSQLVTAMHREQIMEARRQSAQQALEESQEQKNLRKIG
jgi:hypothetical protein